MWGVISGCGSKATNHETETEAVNTGKDDAAGNDVAESEEVVESVDNNENEDIIEDTTIENEEVIESDIVIEKNFKSLDYGRTDNGDGLITKFIYIDNEEKSANVMFYVNIIDDDNDWTPWNYKDHFENGTFKYALYWEGPVGIGKGFGTFPEFYSIHNEENNSIIEFYPNGELVEAQLLESDDSDYDLMISNGQFKYFFTSDYDQDIAWKEFNSIRLLDKEEACELVDTMVKQTEGY